MFVFLLCIRTCLVFKTSSRYHSFNHYEMRFSTLSHISLSAESSFTLTLFLWVDWAEQLPNILTIKFKLAWLIKPEKCPIVVMQWNQSPGLLGCSCWLLGNCCRWLLWYLTSQEVVRRLVGISVVCWVVALFLLWYLRWSLGGPLGLTWWLRCW